MKGKIRLSFATFLRDTSYKFTFEQQSLVRFRIIHFFCQQKNYKIYLVTQSLYQDKSGEKKRHIHSPAAAGVVSRVTYHDWFSPQSICSISRFWPERIRDRGQGNGQELKPKRSLSGSVHQLLKLLGG